MHTIYLVPSGNIGQTNNRWFQLINMLYEIYYFYFQPN